MAGRRELSFEYLDQIMPEVDRLLRGHVRAGQWTLAQILHHLATAVWYSSRKIPGPALDLGSRDDRVAEVKRKRFFRSARFPEGANLPDPSMLPPLDADEREQADSLRSALRSLETVEEPCAVHPFLGSLTKDEWIRFHRMHAAHHLGFVSPQVQG